MSGLNSPQPPFQDPNQPQYPQQPVQQPAQGQWQQYPPQYNQTPPPPPPKKKHTFWKVLGGVLLFLFLVSIVNGLLGEGEADVAEPDVVVQTEAPAKVEKEEPKEEPKEAPKEAPKEEPKEEAPKEEPKEEEPAEPVEPAEPEMTFEQEQAVATALSYLDYSGFSKKGLIGQLEFEEYSKADAKFAVNHIEVDWMEQAVRVANDYLDYDSFSESGLVGQLEFEGFTPEQAQHGASVAFSNR